MLCCENELFTKQGLSLLPFFYILDFSMNGSKALLLRCDVAWKLEETPLFLVECGVSNGSYWDT